MLTRRFLKYLPSIILLLLLISIISGFRSDLQITYYTYKNKKIPQEFNNYRIVQISDLHCKSFGNKNEKLIAAVKNLKPDLIVLTGDMIDGKHPDISPVEYFLSGIANVAPVYSVSGNHEFDLAARYTELKSLYQAYGVTNLDDSQAAIAKDGSTFTLYGLSADRMDILYNRGALPEVDANSFSLVLYHYSNHFDYFTDTGFDLLLAGHTHGGIIRFPFIGGLIGNDGSLFPKYDSGLFTLGTVTMVSSRGLGDADIPRFYNRPEIVCINLQSE
jgi:uncharacterized protein